MKKNKESVWDYPRPPRVEHYPGLVEIVHKGYVLAKSTGSFRVLETSHPPVFYIPSENIMMELLQKTNKTSMCEFKGMAVYFNLVTDDEHINNVAWCYDNPRPGFEAVKGFLAFYPSKVEACFVDGEQVAAQEGDFYGGWITSSIEGPFKGGPGTWGW